DISPDVQQAALSVIGELVPKCWGVVQPYIPKYFPAIVQLTSPSLPLVCNNAVWVIGEVVAQVGPPFEAQLPSVTDTLVNLMSIPVDENFSLA
ncbi:TNPO1, partial [Symbiodinium sp. KB8]